MIVTDREKVEHKDNPITIAAIVGLAWGLVFGLVDGLPALLEGDPLNVLGRRLLTLTYVAVFNALVFGLVMALVGAVVWAILRLTRWQPSEADLLGLLVGLAVMLSTAAFCLQRYPEAALILVAGLALVTGAVAGWLARAAAAAIPANSPNRGERLQMIVLGVFVVGALVLLGAAVFRQSIRDWDLFNPRITDQVPTPDRPNIVLVSIDALRADGLSAYNDGPAVSPRIDALAKRGLVFRQATSQASSTVPSVASFMTSMYPTELGIITGRKWVVDDLRVTLAEALQVAGYRTQAYITNGHLVPGKGYAQGFDGYVAPEPGRPYGLDRLRAETVVAGLACRHKTFVCDVFDGGFGTLFDRLLVMQNEGGRVNDRARRFVRLHRDEQFFLWLHYMEPHAAYSPQRTQASLPSSVSPEREAFLRAWTPANKTTPMVMRPEDLDAVLTLYDGEVLDVDGWVGGIWDEIEAQGLADRTLLVITADHGEEFNEHGEYGHGHTVFQELDRVPLIVVGPQVASPGRAVETSVPMLDLMPTLLEVAGAPLPELVRGQSLLPVLQGEDPPLRPIYTESPARRSSYDDKSLRQGDYKLVYNVRLDEVELYNLQDDPGEQHDLATVEPQRTAAMRDNLRAWTANALRTWASLPQADRRAQELDAAMEEALRQIGY
jgi:arylsulfatase A-like enzyme